MNYFRVNWWNSFSMAFFPPQRTNKHFGNNVCDAKKGHFRMLILGETFSSDFCWNRKNALEVLGFAIVFVQRELFLWKWVNIINAWKFILSGNWFFSTFLGRENKFLFSKLSVLCWMPIVEKSMWKMADWDPWERNRNFSTSSFYLCEDIVDKWNYFICLI